MYYCHTWMPLGLTSSIKFCLLSKPFLDVFVSDTIEMNKKQSQTHLTLHTWHRTSLLLLLRTKLQNVNVFPNAAKLTLAYPVFFLLKTNVSLNNFSIRHRLVKVYHRPHQTYKYIYYVRSLLYLSCPSLTSAWCSSRCQAESYNTWRGEGPQQGCQIGPDVPAQSGNPRLTLQRRLPDWAGKSGPIWQPDRKSVV